MRKTGSHDQTGAVTAETAVILPLLVLFTLGLGWLVCLGATQVRAVDSAREAARVLARGEPPGVARSLARQVAGGSAKVLIMRQDDTVLVRVIVPVAGPGGLFRFLPAYSVRAASVAALEPGQ